MFVRKKNNRSGSISVAVVDKRGGKIHCLKTVGVSSDETEIAELYRQGKKRVSDHSSGKDILGESTHEQEEKQITERFLFKEENVLLNGTQLVLNRLFQRIGFDGIDTKILKHPVVARPCQPSSKAGTVDYTSILF